MDMVKNGFVILMLLVILSACENPPVINEVPVGNERFNGIDAETINIVTDSETGCKYIYVEQGTGNYQTNAMSPLYKSSGVVDCE